MVIQYNLRVELAGGVGVGGSSITVVIPLSRKQNSGVSRKPLLCLSKWGRSIKAVLLSYCSFN